MQEVFTRYCGKNFAEDLNLVYPWKKRPKMGRAGWFAQQDGLFRQKDEKREGRRPSLLDRRRSERPLGLVGVEELMGLVGQGGFHEILVEGQHGGVLVGEAQGVVLIQGVQPLAPLPGQLLAVADGLSAAAGAAAGASSSLRALPRPLATATFSLTEPIW